RRSSHRAVSSRQSLGSLVVTHPFHPLSGCELEILYVKRRSGALVFVCASGAGRSVTLPQAWTDRGVAAEEYPLAVEGLCAARALVNALVSRGADEDGGGS
ncbi:DUF5372 family protein, partial [Streptomyces sp. NPDC056159]|uniref:DUF5372 family protein n=1 Tax=Streptomyces sp. NPDC056159 TaxID=3155537 RepID=UPI00342F0134